MLSKDRYKHERDWWDYLCSYLRNCPGMTHNLDDDAIKANMMGKLNNLANFCEHEADTCQKMLDNLK